MILTDFYLEIFPILKELFKENPYLEHFMNNISHGKRDRSYKYNIIHRLITNYEYESHPNRNGHYYWTKIQIESFNSLKLSNMISNHFGKDYYIENEFDKFKTFSLFELLKRNNSAYSLGVRVFKNVKTRGSLINSLNIQELINKEYVLIQKHINEFYYIGDNRVLLALSTTDGQLIIRFETLVSIIKHNPKSVVKNVLKNLLISFNRLNELSESVNIRDIEDDLVHGCLARVTAGRKHFIPSYTRTFNETTLISFENKIIEKIKNNIENIFNGTMYNVENSRQYQRIISDFISKRRKFIKDSNATAFFEGMQFGMKLEMIGWHQCPDPNFVSCKDVGAFWWTKDVNIIPDTFIKNKRRYMLEENQRIWVINKLYINQFSHMYCKSPDGVSEHPNVNNGRVCMGDLIIDFKEHSQKLFEQLSDAEKLLDIINFDSSYRQYNCDELTLCCKVSDLLGNNDSYQIKSVSSRSSIKELNFNDDELDLSDPSQEVEELNITNIITDDGSVVGSIIRENTVYVFDDQDYLGDDINNPTDIIPSDNSEIIYSDGTTIRSVPDNNSIIHLDDSHLL